MGRKARFSPNIQHSTPENRLQMLVVNVKNSQKMLCGTILRQYVDACAYKLPSCCSLVPGCIIFSITDFTKDFERKHFPSLTVAIKTTLQLRNKLPFLLSSRGYLSHIVWRAFRLLTSRFFALRMGRHLSPLKYWVTSSHIVPTRRN